MIELTMLRYFISAFETESFSNAARANGVSQPTVSAAIQKLESKLGGALFQRSRSGLKATPLAVSLYHDAAESVTHLAKLEMRIRKNPQHVVRVYCAPDILLHGIAPSLNSLRRNMPDLTFSFTQNLQESDMAYLSEQCVPEGHKFVPLGEEQYGVVLPLFHPLASMSGGVRGVDVFEYPLIHRPYCPSADRMNLRSGQAETVAQATNDQQLLDLVAAGLGIAFVPFSHGDARDDIVVRHLTDGDAGTRTIGISHRKTAFATKLATMLSIRGHSSLLRDN